MDNIFRVTTSNIKDEFKSLTEEYGLDPNSLDFDIISSTMDQTEQGFKATYEVEFIKRTPDLICQIIDIEIDNSTPAKNAFLKVDCTKLTQSLSESLDNIVKAIKKKLALYGIVYGVKENNLPLIAKEIQKRLSPNFSKFKVLVASGKVPVNGQNSQLKTFFQLNTVGLIDEKGNINFKEKNFAIGVDVGTIIAHYIKPTKGIPGIDIFGYLIPAEDGKDIQKINIKIDSADIEKQEDEVSIKFVSKKKGSLILKNNIFHVEDIVKLNKADIKTGNIDLKNVSDVNVGVSNDLEEDMIGAGIKVTGKKVVVNGNIGPNAVVEGDVVDIKGSVHKDATIKANIAKIKTLNGTLIANEAYIESANYATIETQDKVVIDDCLACNITSPNVNIKHKLLSSNIITSSKETILNDVVGNDNTISVKPLKIKQIAQAYETLLLEEKILVNELKNTKAKLEMLKQKSDSNLKNFSEALKVVKELQSKGKQVPSAILTSVKNFKDTQEEYKQEKEKLIELENKYSNLTTQIKELVESYKKAHIIIKGDIDADNLIEFDDMLSRRLVTKQHAVKIHVRTIGDKETIVIEPLS